MAQNGDGDGISPNLKSLIAAVGLGAAGSKLLEIALVNGIDASSFIPFPFKPKPEKKEVTVLTTVTKTVFHGKNVVMTHSEYSLSDWNEKNHSSTIEAELDEKAKQFLKERMKKAEMEMENEKEKQKKKVWFI